MVAEIERGFERGRDMMRHTSTTQTAATRHTRRQLSCLSSANKQMQMYSESKQSSPTPSVSAESVYNKRLLNIRVYCINTVCVHM